MCPSTYLFSVHCTWRSGNPEDLREFLQGDGEQCESLSSTAQHPSVLNVRYNGAKKQDPDVHRGRRTGLCSVACRHYLVSTSVFAASPKLRFTLLLSCGQSQPLYEPGKTEHELSHASSPAPPLEHSGLRHAVFLPNLWLSSLGMGVQPQLACCLSH